MWRGWESVCQYCIWQHGAWLAIRIRYELTIGVYCLDVVRLVRREARPVTRARSAAADSGAQGRHWCNACKYSCVRKSGAFFARINRRKSCKEWQVTGKSCVVRNCKIISLTGLIFVSKYQFNLWQLNPSKAWKFIHCLGELLNPLV